MNVFTKDPRSPEVVEALKKDGQVLVEITSTSLYLLDCNPHVKLEELFQQWFVQFRGRSHAYRDGCHIGGTDVVSEVKVLTEQGRVIAIKNPA